MYTQPILVPVCRLKSFLRDPVRRYRRRPPRTATRRLFLMPISREAVTLRSIVEAMPLKRLQATIGISEYGVALLAVMCLAAGTLILITIMASTFSGLRMATAAMEGSWAAMACPAQVSMARMGEIIPLTPITNVPYG